MSFTEWVQHLQTHLDEAAAQTPAAVVTAPGAGAAGTGVDVDRDLRLAAMLCHDCWCAVARLSLTDASSQGPPEQLPSMAKGSTGAGGCIDASDIVDALVSGADRDGWYAPDPRHASVLRVPACLVVT